MDFMVNMETTQLIRADIRSWIEGLHGTRPVVFADSDDLFSLGILNSLDYFGLILLVEKIACKSILDMNADGSSFISIDKIMLTFFNDL